ncbi:MAG: CotH kinase family protein [Chitinophagales bacterium]
MKHIPLLFLLLCTAVAAQAQFSATTTERNELHSMQPSFKMDAVELDSTNLPIVLIDTYGEEIPDEPRITAAMGIIWNGTEAMNHIDDLPNNYNGSMAIEIRGSSAQFFPKKCYALELQDADGNAVNASLLGLPKDDDWILYGPYTDKTCLRNALAMTISARMGNYAPRFAYCEVVLNGEYQGLYLLMEKLKIQKNRVAIHSMSTGDVAGIDVTGGYVIKVDRNNADSPVIDYFESAYEGTGWPSDVLYVYADPHPEDINTAQKSYIEDFVDAFEDVMHSADKYDPYDGYRKYIDINAFADFFLVQELSRNVDAYRLSTYFYKNNDAFGTRLFAGPVWDFNLAFGNANYCSGWTTSGFFTDCGTGPTWWTDLYNDEAFQNLLASRWNTLRAGPLSSDSLNAWIDAQVAYIGDAVERNEDTWNVIGNWVWPNYYVGPSYASEINYFKLWLNARLAWMDTHMPGDPDAEAETTALETISITEFNYNSDDFNPSNDWVELHNYGNATVDLSGWTLSDETPFNNYVIPNEVTIEPNAYLVLVQTTDTFLMAHPGVTNYIGDFNFGFDNGGGTIKLKDNDGFIVKQINYEDTIPWPKGSDGYGPSNQILNELADENDPANWIAGCVLGTPGYAYTPCDYPILVDEINYNSLPGFNPGDWVEILNRGTENADISGWILRDANDGNQFIFPAGTILAPNGRLCVVDSMTSFTEHFPAVSNVTGESDFHFSNGGDAIRLYNTSGKIQYSIRYYDKVPWPTDPDGNGFTLENNNLSNNPNIPSDWVAGCLYGSPGTEFILPVLPPSMIWMHCMLQLVQTHSMMLC